MTKILIPLFALLWLSACATGPRYPTSGVAVDLQPAEVASSTANTHRGGRVIWGGMIVATRNLSQYTEIEVLGYPLDSNQRPQTSRSPQGRFLVRQAGYLEEMNHAPGRHITVRGTLADNLEGQVGEASYRYPLVQAQDIHLWAADRDGDSGRTRFNIGVGVIFGR